MADIIVLNAPKIDTVTINDDIELLDQNMQVEKFDTLDSLNITTIKKLGNYTEWEFRIYQTSSDDSAWSTLISNLEALNTGTLFNFTPDTIDNASEIYKSWCWFFHDEVNESPLDFIYGRILRFYSNGNEA